MKKRPQVAGLILCHRMEVNTATVELCLAGLFHALSFPKFPALATPFTVYTEVFDALAEGTMELAVMQLETERQIYVQPRWFASSDRGLVFPLEWRVRKCVFPAPGRYMMTLRFDGEELSQRYLDVNAEETAHER